MKFKKSAHHIFRPFSLLFGVLAVIAIASTSSAAEHVVYGGAYGSWPTSWTPVSSLGDPIDSVTGRLDFVGAATTEGDADKYAFYVASDDTYAYFRLRVYTGTWGGIVGYDPGGVWTDNIWVMIDGDRDNSPDYALAWDSNTSDPDAPTQPHGLEFQVINTINSTWAGTDFDDIDRKASKKLVTTTDCDETCGGGNHCWHLDIPYSGGTGYVRAVDGERWKADSDSMFIDIAVTWDYLISASTKANECTQAWSLPLPVLTKYHNWKLQAGSRNNANDHAAVSTDVAGNTNPSDNMAWSTENPTLVELVSFTATPSHKGIFLEWETASEIDTAGFYIWRSEGHDRMYNQITNTLIPAEGGVARGAVYMYKDNDVARKIYFDKDEAENHLYIYEDLADGQTYSYKLETIDSSGASQFFGPISAGLTNPKPNRTVR